MNTLVVTTTFLASNDWIVTIGVGNTLVAASALKIKYKSRFKLCNIETLMLLYLLHVEDRCKIRKQDHRERWMGSHKVCNRGNRNSLSGIVYTGDQSRLIYKDTDHRMDRIRKRVSLGNRIDMEALHC